MPVQVCLPESAGAVIPAVLLSGQSLECTSSSPVTSGGDTHGREQPNFYTCFVQLVRTCAGMCNPHGASVIFGAWQENLSIC